MKNLILIFGFLLALSSCRQGYQSLSSGNNGSVGSNAGKFAVEQCCTPFGFDLCATATAADIVQLAVDLGSTHNDVASTPFATTDYIHHIDIDLKGVDGEGQCWSGTEWVTTIATSCDAIYAENGGQSNMDPGGSRENDGGNKSTGGTYQGYQLPNKFEGVTVEPGSIVTVSGEICQDPAELSSVKKT